MKKSTSILLLSALTLCAASATAKTPFTLGEAAASSATAAPAGVSLAPTGVSVSPAEGRVPSLKDFTVTFHNATSVVKGALGYGNAPNVHKTGSDAGRVFCFNMTFDGNVMTLSAQNEVTEEGDWTLTLPAGFYNIDGVASTETIEFNYTIGSAEIVEGQIIKEQPSGKRVEMMTRTLNWFVIGGNLYGQECAGKPVHYVLGNDGYIYLFNPIIKNMFTNVQVDAYIRGEKDGDEYVFKFPQPIYEETVDGQTQTWYVNRLAIQKQYDTDGNETGSDYVVAEDNTLRMKFEEDGSLTATPQLSRDNAVGVMVNDKWNGFGNTRMLYRPLDFTVATPPADLETIPAEMTFNAYVEGGYKTTYPKVGIVGDDIWIQGMGYTVLPDAWIHGTIGTDNVVTFDPYLGLSERYGQHMFLRGASTDESLLLYDAQMTYDRTAMTLTATRPLALNTNNEFWYAIEQFTDCVITLQTEDDGLTTRVPKAPEKISFGATIEDPDQFLVTVTLSNINVDGQELNVDKLTYQFILPSGEPFVFHPWQYASISKDVDAIPYNRPEHEYTFMSESANKRMFTLKGQPGLENIGARLIYTDATGANYSEITWAKEVSAIDEVADRQPAAVEYYDLMGRPVANPRSGCYIKVTTAADRTRKVEKIAL